MDILKKIKGLIPKNKGSKKKFYWLLSILTLLLLVFVLRGCSGNGVMGKKKSYVIGRENASELDLLGREHSLTGFTNDLFARIGEENGIRFYWTDAEPASLVNNLNNHHFDFILTTLRPDVINREKYDFSELIFELGPVLVVRQSEAITSLKEMGSKPIGISYGFSTHFNAVREPGVNIYDLSLVYYNNINRALDDLNHDHIDGVIMPAIPAYAIAHGLYAGGMKVVTAPLTDEGFRIVSLKSSSHEEIIDLINAGVDAMRKDGSYRALIEKWNLVDPQTQYWQSEKK